MRLLSLVALVSVAASIAWSSTSFAQAVPTQAAANSQTTTETTVEPTTPACVLPSACHVSTNPDNPDPNPVPEPVPSPSPNPAPDTDPTPTPDPVELHLNLTAPGLTNNPDLIWTWTVTAPVDPSETSTTPTELPVAGFGYVLYHDGQVVEHGQFGADVSGYHYQATTDGQYTLYVWVIPSDSSQAVAYCANGVINLDTAAPVIADGGLQKTGSTAVPQLTTDEKDLTFSWTVGVWGGSSDSVLSTDVAVSDAQALNPNFTFLKDGKYVLRLTATDQAGNSKIMTYDFVYTTVVFPGPTTPLIPVDLRPEPVADYVKPVDARAALATTLGSDILNSASSSTGASQNGAVSSSAASTDDEPTVKSAETVAALAPSSEGWKIFGIAWYWWLLVAAIIVSGWLWSVRTIRSRNLPDDI